MNVCRQLLNKALKIKNVLICFISAKVMEIALAIMRSVHRLGLSLD